MFCEGQLFHSILRFTDRRERWSLQICSLRRLRHGNICGVEHIFNENAVARGGGVDEHVRNRADELAVLNDGGA